MTSEAYKNVQAFHNAFGLPDRQTPTIGTERERALRTELILEEAFEWNTAVISEDMVEMLDALADIVYVVYGAALTFGFDLDGAIEEVHRSNMSKLGDDGLPQYSETGKVLKGVNYSPPDLRKFVGGGTS